MLEAANLLPIYGGFEAISNKIAWPSFYKCLGLRFSAQTHQKHVVFLYFCPDFVLGVC